MPNPIHRVRTFVNDVPPVVTHLAVGAIAFGIGTRLMSNAWTTTIRDELGQEVLDRLIP